MNHPDVRSQLNEFFAMKRKERPPEKFMSEFVEEFHRRNEREGPDSRNSIFSKKFIRQKP